MSTTTLDIVILGLSITSSWGNGHATTYRSLVRSLDARGHRVLFLERDVPWYATQRDMPRPPFGRTELYRDLHELRSRFVDAVREADLVIVGSYVPEGIAVGEWVVEQALGGTAFYDIDTPVTLARLAAGEAEYISPELIPRYGMYLSFTGGPVLRHIERAYGAPAARALYCSVDGSLYRPMRVPYTWDLGYMGTYSLDRQAGLEQFLLEPARRWPQGRFAVAGPQYPPSVRWPDNVWRTDHLPPRRHRSFYNRQRFTLNLTRADMVAVGYSPSVRLFEAAACATPVISDAWPGLETFFVPDEEILIARTTEHVLDAARNLSDAERRAIGAAARERVLSAHTAAHRALELEQYVAELQTRQAA
jgi:spore maturation protein CgeB